MFAVIKTGGKQYRVKEGDVLSIEKVEAAPGEAVTFDQVLLIEAEDRILVGSPYLEKAAVTGEVIETYKDDKVTVFKKKRRKGYRRTKGHRQMLTKIKIDGIYPEWSGHVERKPAEEEAQKPVEKAVRTRARKATGPEVAEAEKTPTKKTPRTAKKVQNKEESKEN
ncbi:MAG TPA: 50S ribosomal protein L21 [Candidatus Saccharicenans sp.]|jgi:large subunit ribosomal protein L21|nr:50S ribosomal protein L21 [Candidatus Saccharicenans sp.]HQM73751.1 50S ribosomal protein L21 [Candidatus Saccharicenans sp.]